MQSGSTTELEVQWREPHHSDPNPPDVDSYDVRYRVVDAQTWQDGPQAVTVTRAALTGLTTGTQYEVQSPRHQSGWRQYLVEERQGANPHHRSGP